MVYKVVRSSVTHLVRALQRLDRLAALADDAADHALGALHDPRDAGPKLHLRANVVSAAGRGTCTLALADRLCEVLSAQRDPDFLLSNASAPDQTFHPATLFCGICTGKCQARLLFLLQESRLAAFGHTFWMMACALPGSPWMSSCTIFTARSTASGLPLILIWRGSPSGKSCAKHHDEHKPLQRSV